MINLDIQISQYFFSLGRELPSWLVYFFATGMIWILLVFVLIFIASERTHRLAILARVLVAALAAFAVNAVIAWFYFRTRPFAALGFDPLIAVSSFDKSFPSDHASVGWALAASLFFINKKSALAAFLFALLIIAGRMLAGVHYFADVAVGAFIGLSMAFLVFKIRAKLPLIGEEQQKRNHSG